MRFDSAELDAHRGTQSMLFATATSSSSSQRTHTHNPPIPLTCHPEDTCPICQMYADHFDFPTLNSRREQHRDYENQTHQVDIELLKLELWAARDRILALETAYDELQLAYEEAARKGVRNDGNTMLGQEEIIDEIVTARSISSSASASNQDYVDVDQQEWEIPATPWTGNSPSSSGSLPLLPSIGTIPYPASTENIPRITPVSTISTPSSLSSFSTSAGSTDNFENEPETPLLTNGSQEDALRYAELLEQCNYNVKAANAVWKEWEAAERERQTFGQDIGTSNNILGEAFDEDSEDDTEDENPDSDWEWEPYDYNAYERTSSPARLSPINLSSCSSSESIHPVQTSDIHRDLIRVQTRPRPVLPFPLSLTHVHTIPCPQNEPVDVEPTIHVDASATGIGFCFCVPTSTNSKASTSSKSMTCYWLTWKWVRGHPSIPVGVSGQLVMSWAELIALELGVHVTCAMRSTRGDTHTSSPPFFTFHQGHRAPFACSTTENLTIHSDNTGVVTALSPAYRTWTPKHGLDAIVRRILNTCEEQGAQLAVRWVPSKSNLADGPSKGRGVHVRDGAGDVVVSAVGSCGERLELGDVDALESEAGRAIKWMEWVGASLHVPNHMQSFVQGPTGGVVELRHMLNG